LVVGGGNTAMDAACTAARLGAKDVTVVYRRAEQQMPAWQHEVERARRLGVRLRTQLQPVQVLVKGKRAAGLRCVATELAEPDESGRRRPVPVAGAGFDLEADSIIVAIGEALDEELAAALGLEVEEPGRVKDNPAMKVFAAGDLAGTARTVVDAVASGRGAATRLHLALGFEEVAGVPELLLPREVDLSVDFCGVRFENPFVLAAAPPTDELDMVARGLEAGWAGAVLKTTAVESEPVDLKYPMMQGYAVYGRHVVGLGNIDLISQHHIDVVEQRVRHLKKEFPSKVVIGSIMGSEKQHWQQLVERLEAAGVDVIECSFSCPQGTLGGEGSFAGQMLGQNAELTREVTSWIKGAAKRVPVVIKITPQVADVRAVARAVAEGGADAVCASNTIPSLMGIDLASHRPAPSVGGMTSFAGLSGPAILPITLRNIALVAQASGLPVTGTGGPVSWQDAVQMMLVGAHNVQFCTAVMAFGYEIIQDLLSGMAWYLLEMGLEKPAQLVGRALGRITTHDRLVQPGKVVSRIDASACIGCG
ncbi:MAG: NAD-dependent dihydropyrimidine dehydrogenase subunit PreA, partial [Deltaproteobacteria bacterium]